MIFVILGTQKFQLNRLLIELDEMCEKGIIKEEIVAQIGCSTYKPKNYKYYDFIDKDEFERMISKSSLVISHSGVGSIITALEFRKPTIVFPRLQKYGEHIDDHQLEIAMSFERRGYVLCCNEDDNLQELINTSLEYEFAMFESNSKKIIKIINDFIGIS